MWEGRADQPNMEACLEIAGECCDCDAGGEVLGRNVTPESDQNPHRCKSARCSSGVAGTKIIHGDSRQHESQERRSSAESYDKSPHAHER